ncbi:hypothetical protein [Actinorhabdospora filicis]|uniref:hypothetical protein n=1 Tax=Actinorhabdospora filicis TaxID=1785913 RepID=UPI0025563C7B|nr:hypothetical protein [Actinorhabdospora filicis]
MLLHNLADLPPLVTALGGASSTIITVGVLSLLERGRRRYRCTTCQLVGSLIRRSLAAGMSTLHPRSRGRHRMWDLFEHQSGIRSDHHHLTRRS